MTRTAFLPWPVFKEVRALLFPWLACVLVMIVPTPVHAPRYVEGISVIVYFLGAAVLGALSIGREYTEHTLGLLLSQPVGRKRLFLIKFSVLAAMLLTLCAVGHTGVFHGMARAPLAEKLEVVLLPLLYALCITPWLTMASRSAAAGILFTMAIPVLLAVLGAGIVRWLGIRADAFSIVFQWRGTLGICAIGAVATWRMFMRIEAIEGQGEALDLTQWLRSRTTAKVRVAVLTKRHPIWLLITKELRVQQLALVLAGLYLFGWLAVTLMRPVADLFGTFNALSVLGGAFNVLSPLYALLLGALIGSVASAEERQFGTLEWHVLLPIATSRQWAVKVGVALGLTMLLGISVPAVLTQFNLAMDPKPFFEPRFDYVSSALVLTALVLTAGSLYVSSLCTSGVWALVMSLPTMVGASIFLSFAIVQVGDASYTAWSRLFSALVPSVVGRVDLVAWRVTQALNMLLIGGFIALLMRFALTNHRFADRPAARVLKQALLLALFATAAVVVARGVTALQGRRW